MDGRDGTITGYNVYRGTAAGGESTTPINSSPLAATATSYADTTAVAGNTYYYVVKAINAPRSARLRTRPAYGALSECANAEVDLPASTIWRASRLTAPNSQADWTATAMPCPQPC